MKIYKFLFIFLLSIIPFSVQSSVSDGTIDSSNKNALVCHSVDCVNPAPDIINFFPTGGSSPVVISDTAGITGVIWGNKIGWINLSPTGAGLTIDPSTGIISGKAWSQVSGWINFSVTGQTVKINNNGEFEGWAWTGGTYGGWIKFDCSSNDSCVKTDWRPLSARPKTKNTTVTSGGSTADLNIANNDICPNIIGFQDKVPDNYIKDKGGLCSLKVDYCKNIEDIQSNIPNGYVLNDSGQCVILNNENKDIFFPDINKDSLGTNSIEVYNDFCLNLFGLQSYLPDGFVSNDKKDCVPRKLDYCPNILGEQYEIPKYMKISNDGSCVKMTKEEIIESDQIEELNNKNKILGYSFIPNWLVLPISIPFIGNMLGIYKLDLISSVITIMFISFIVLIIKIKLINRIK